MVLSVSGVVGMVGVRGSSTFVLRVLVACDLSELEEVGAWV
jgi:hypothetical protein